MRLPLRPTANSGQAVEEWHARGAIDIPSVRKSTAATSQSISLNMGRTPSRRRPSSSLTQIDAEPSVSGKEFPAVSEPALLRSNTAGSLASFSSDVSGLGHLAGDGKDGDSSWHASSLRIRDRRKRNVPWQ
jgi:hypothetical protein